MRRGGGRGPVVPPAGDAVDGAATVPKGAPPAGPKQPLRTVVSADTAKRLNFGVSSDGTAIGADDFASAPSAFFEVTLPDGVTGFEFQADAQVGSDRDQVYRITFSDRENGAPRGIPVR